jgi:hypothetical protein
MRSLVRYFVCLAFIFFLVSLIEIDLLGILSIPNSPKPVTGGYHLCLSFFSANGVERFCTEIRSLCSETKATGV